ncbi:hypothetical protein C9374_009367 [Naegleria lovaniensis]|uniref:Uncharacterized protein n=1 Tax=Naegleria lovaniensis TaxID=51637 RepID=A0AA88KGS5_NAELO|nr:uncharacterized protein C9374_009367 [Naegleria lovaniensis]KAG2377456.1 hypothetical protein C9374_009367 [Naegleria lovaniensis]
MYHLPIIRTVNPKHPLPQNQQQQPMMKSYEFVSFDQYSLSGSQQSRGAPMNQEIKFVNCSCYTVPENSSNNCPTSMMTMMNATFQSSTMTREHSLTAVPYQSSSSSPNPNNKYSMPPSRISKKKQQHLKKKMSLSNPTQSPTMAILNSTTSSSSATTTTTIHSISPNSMTGTSSNSTSTTTQNMLFDFKLQNCGFDFVVFNNTSPTTFKRSYNRKNGQLTKRQKELLELQQQKGKASSSLLNSTAINTSATNTTSSLSSSSNDEKPKIMNDDDSLKTVRPTMNLTQPSSSSSPMIMLGAVSPQPDQLSAHPPSSSHTTPQQTKSNQTTLIPLRRTSISIAELLN